MPNVDPSRLARAKGGPGPGTPFIPVWWPKHLAPVRCIVLSESVWEYYTHWVDNRTEPCIEPASECPGCKYKWNRRWKGYVAALIPSNRRLCLVEISKDAARNCPMLTSGKVNLRGGELTLKRSGEHKRSPVRAEFKSAVAARDLPPEFDVDAALCRIWNGEDDRGTEQEDRIDRGEGISDPTIPINRGRKEVS